MTAPTRTSVDLAAGVVAYGAARENENVRFLCATAPNPSARAIPLTRNFGARGLFRPLSQFAARIHHAPFVVFMHCSEPPVMFLT